ncbi:mitogen-activated protein kinase kinase kinase dlk-1-like [Sycon ciliatum]|uniref:mitogen-activated protein kinase kinase kinase dlk-1-like n=1 Tax=Sycon ciliatum TaxID=27933 RepID=UPI0031F5F08A
MATSPVQRSQRSLSLAVPFQHLLHGVEQEEKVLGRGAHGVVFAGSWNGTAVAIKRHHPVLALDEHGQLSANYQQFLREFPLLNELPHPNIVQVFGMVSASGPNDTPGLVMECLSQTLRQRCSTQPALSRVQEADIALGVSSALLYLHSLNIVHRDLTTNNIMVSSEVGMPGGVPQLRAKITDVGGAAKLAHPAEAESLTMNPGAQTYMAPETQQEYADGDGGGEQGQARYGTPADCYSFGVSILAMCVRREPPSIFTLMRRGRSHDLNALGAYHPFHAIISQCLEVNPARRPSATHINQAVRVAKESLLRQPPVDRPVAKRRTLSADHAENEHMRRELQEQKMQLSAVKEQLLAAQRQSQSHTRLALQDREALIAERDAAIQQLGEVLVQTAVGTHDAERRAGDNGDMHEQQMRDSLFHLASIDGPAGVQARCSLIIGPPPSLSRGARPKATWKNVGKLPIAISNPAQVGSVAYHQGRVYTTLLLEKRWQIFSTDSKNLAEPAWFAENPLNSLQQQLPDTPRIFGVREHNNTLYLIVVFVSTPSILYSRLDNGGWRQVAQLPRFRMGFSITFLDNHLVIIGGSTGTHAFVPVRPDVISFNLGKPGNAAEWIAWPDFPQSCGGGVLKYPHGIVHAGYLHIIGGDYEHGAATRRSILSAPPTKHVHARSWSTDVLPKLPFPNCLLRVFNGCLGCYDRYGLSHDREKQFFMLSPVSQQWLPLPSTNPKDGFACDLNGRMVLFTPTVIQELCWE